MKKGLKQFTLLLLLSCLTFKPMPAYARTEPNPPNVSAQAAVVIDYETGTVLYEKNKDNLMVPASMTKVMTAYIIFEEFEAGRLRGDTPITISNNAANISRNNAYPMAVPLPAGGTVPADTLLRLILIPSASASCIAMAEHIAGSEEAFVQRMNDTAAKMGLTAQYLNCHGAKPNYITPYSQAKLTANFIRRFPAILSYTGSTSVDFNGANWKNTNGLLPGGAYVYAGADGFKTGTIAEAGYCLSSTAVRNDKRVICIVMKSSNNATRHTDSIRLLDYGFSALATLKPTNATPKNNKAKTPVTEGNFDANRYANDYPDLKAAFGYNRNLLWNHYVNNGARENRVVYTTGGDAGYLASASATGVNASNFDSDRYANDYADLKAAFGYNKDLLWSHYVNNGMKEGRKVYAVGTTQATQKSQAATVTNGINANNFDFKRYANDYADLKAAFGDNKDLLWNHYVNYGIKEGRKVYAVATVPAK